MQLSPSSILAPYIKNYSVITIENDLDNEVFYPSGYVDMVINLGGAAATIINGKKKDTPAIELLGHLTLPARLSVAKGTMVLIARIYPYAGALFFSNPLQEFTNYATDLHDVGTNTTNELYDKLMHAATISDKINVLEAYFLQQLHKNEKQLKKVAMIKHLCHLSVNDNNFDLSSLVKHVGVSERYVQRLYTDHVGISPASVVAVTKFNKALHLMRSTQMSLTHIAYECGYYDQAHFIRSFKKFTGVAPLEARRSLAGVNDAAQQAVNVGF